MLEEIKDSIKRIKLSIENYDNGNYTVARDLSNQIALFCYDTKSIKSLLTQSNDLKNKIQLPVANKGIDFENCSIKLCAFVCYNASNSKPTLTISDSSFKGSNCVCVPVNKAKFVSVYKDKCDKSKLKYQTFEEWWQTENIITINNINYKREQIIKFIRHKDLGAHKEKNPKDKDFLEYKELNKMLQDGYSYNIVNETNTQKIESDYSGVYEVVRSIASELIMGLEQIVDCG